MNFHWSGDYLTGMSQDLTFGLAFRSLVLNCVSCGTPRFFWRGVLDFATLKVVNYHHTESRVQQTNYLATSSVF